MSYRDRSPWIRLPDLLQFIADEATDGDMEAAWDDLLAAAADGAITAYCNEQTGSHNGVIPKWAWDAVRRGDAGWIEDGCLIASSNNDPLYVYTDIYQCRWTDVRFPREAKALWARDQPIAAGVAGPAEPPSAPPRRPGPRPSQRPRVETAMRADLEQGRFTRADLNSMKNVEMAERYKASPDTCRKARDAVLSQFGADRPVPIFDE
jgi:hypothetical protein